MKALPPGRSTKAWREDVVKGWAGPTTDREAHRMLMRGRRCSDSVN
mgnify:FL=1|jgi:hypothetical protein